MEKIEVYKVFYASRKWKEDTITEPKEILEYLADGWQLRWIFNPFTSKEQIKKGLFIEHKTYSTTGENIRNPKLFTKKEKEAFIEGLKEAI